MKDRYTLPVLLLVFVVLAAGIIAAGCLLYRSQRDGCRLEAEYKLAAVVDLKVSELSAWRKERLSDANVFFKNKAFSALVRRCSERPQDLPLQEELRTWISHFLASNHYDQITLLDAACNDWISVPDTKKSHSTLTPQKAREAMRSGQILFADFYPDESTQKVYLRLFVPIFDGLSDKRPLGVLRLKIDPEVYLYPLIQRWPMPSETAETLMICREGNEAVFLNELRFQKNTALTLRVPLDSTDRPAAKAALGEEGIVKGVDYRGVPVLAAVHAVPDSPWFLVAKIDATEVYAPMRERLWMTVLFVGVLLFGVAAAVGFIWRQQHSILYREKYEAERKYRAIIEASADGILMADVETKTFKYPNPALCRILGYTERELRSMTVADIHPKDALQNILAEFEGLVREGKGVAQDIPCLRKDGVIVYMDINTTSATIDGRKCLVCVFRDTTERKQHEERSKKLLVRRQGINELQQSLLSQAPLEEKLRKVTDGIVRLFDADFCRIWLIRPGDLCQGECVHAVAENGAHVCRRRDRCLHLLASSGRYTHIDGQTHRRVPFGCYKIGRIASGEDHKFLTNDAQNDPGIHNHQWARELGIVSFAGYQIRVPGGETLGVLGLFAKHPIDESEDAMLDGLSATVALVVEQATAQESLREANQHLRIYKRLIESSPTLLGLVDRGYVYRMANAAYVHERRGSGGEIVGHTVEEVLGKKDFEQVRPYLDQCFAGATVRFGDWFSYPDVGRRFLEISYYPLPDEKGQTEAVIAEIHDATKREHAEESLERAKIAAEAANHAKSQFLANMSHEIRTPMTAILGYADFILDENVGRDVREHVAVIKRNGEHLLQVISDILDLSKIEAGRVQVEPTRCSPVQLVAEVVSLMRPQAAAKQLNLKTELAHPLPETVLTDPLRLRQVLVNLVGNAIKFTNQGDVRIAVRLNTDRDHLSLCFDVTDTGIGMNEEQVGKLFQPFNQVDNSSTRKFGGTGLGLCISRHLAEALGGTIDVRSEPGKGSTFSVTIDPGLLDGTHMIQNAQEALLDRPPSMTTATPDKIVLHGRILLAEDGLDNQRLICLLLRNAGAQVSVVENGQLAVETALAACEAGEPFDVILMDMQMPVLDGYQATWQLRKLDYAGPIVALTAHAMVEDCQKCLDAGCDDYLPKPFQHRALLEMVARAYHCRERAQTSCAE